jgi:nitric oxide synthase-interacting protein
MSKHSKNCTSSSVFTYRERQKLKGTYGTNDTRIGQDSMKKFEMCTICNNRLIEPTACDQGHLFCRSCVVEFLVKQKQRIAEDQAEVERVGRKKELVEREKQMEKEVARLDAFETYDLLSQVTRRGELAQGAQLPPPEIVITQKDVKPIGIYELNAKKGDYVKTAFWSLENAPTHVDHVEKIDP